MWHSLSGRAALRGVGKPLPQGLSLSPTVKILVWGLECGDREAGKGEELGHLKLHCDGESPHFRDFPPYLLCRP